MLWNPIHRKTLKNRPEERVRLRIIEFLLEAGWSKNRISTEEAIRDYTDASLRTDIICYSRDFNPRILAECKAENIALNAKTAEQVARYNQQVNAPYVLLTNGLTDYWYRVDREKEKITGLEKAPDLFPATEKREKDYSYWEKRGFAGKRATAGLKSWLNPLLNTYAEGESTSIQYLQFNNSPSQLVLDHYYQITPLEHQKIALSTLSTPTGGSRLVAILNEEGKNRAVAEINLDSVFEGKPGNTTLYSAAGTLKTDLREEPAGQIFRESSPGSLQEVANTLHTLFAKYPG